MISGFVLGALVFCGVVGRDEEPRNSLSPFDGYCDPIWDVETQSGERD
jgi:hypothetical protein